MNAILKDIQDHAAALPLSLQAELLHYAIFLEQKIQQEKPVASTQQRRERFAEALAQAVTLNPFAEIADPVVWQREQRQDRTLPGRNHAD